MYICSTFKQKKKPKKKFEVKSEEKKNCNRAKPTTSPTDYKGSKPTHKFSKKKKHKESKIKSTITSLAEKAEKTKPQYSLYKAKAKQTPIQRCLSKKKKNQYRANQNQTKKTPILTRCRRSSLLVIFITGSLAPHHRCSPLIADCRSQITLLRCSVLGAPSLKVFLSLFLSDSLSVSLSLSH